MVFCMNREGCWGVKTSIRAEINQIPVFGEAEKAELAVEGSLESQGRTSTDRAQNCPGASRAFLGRGDPSLPGETRDERIVLAAPGGILGSRVPGAGGERVLPKGLCPLLLAQAERGELRPTDPVLSKGKGRPRVISSRGERGKMQGGIPPPPTWQEGVARWESGSSPVLS